MPLPAPITRTIAAGTALVLTAIAGLAIAQPSQPATTPTAPNAAPQPKDPKPASANPGDAAKPTDAKPDAKSASPAPSLGYPEPVQKNLYADKDFRGKKAPTIEVEEWFSEKPDTAGKTILIDMWATWCGPCRQLIPELESFQEKFKGDLVVIGITSESAMVYHKFINDRGHAITYNMARDGLGKDGQSRMFSAVGVKGIPHVLVISSDGIVRWQGFPQSSEEPLTEAKLKQIIDTDKAARAKNPKPALAPGSDTKKTATPPAGK